jgi:hypothetical protein
VKKHILKLVLIGVLNLLLGFVVGYAMKKPGETIKEHMEFIARAQPTHEFAKYRIELMFSARVLPDGKVEIAPQMFERGTHE